MVSPSKKRQIKGRVTAAFKSDRKEKSSSKLPYKPLFNKKFYLDVKGYRDTASVTADIQNLGGIVEEFLSREVNYVISTRGSQAAGESSSEQQPSPSAVHVASPLTPQQPLSSLPSTSHDSPLNIDSPREDNGKKRVRTRAEVLLERACVRRQGTSDVLENARLWNVPVWPLAKLLKWIALLKKNDRYKPPQKTSAINSKNSSSSPKVQRLKAPFIKTESFSRQYKPIFKELTVWPELNLANPPGVSPFADPSKVIKSHKNPKTSSVQKEDRKEKQKVKERNAARTKDSGYCELCCTNFTNLKLHLQSDTHTAFVKNDRNYSKLDELINGVPRQNTQMPKLRCTSKAQNRYWASKKEHIASSNTSQGTSEHKVANEKELQTKDNSFIPMRFNGLMQAERRPSTLSSVTNKRLPKQIVFKIGETIHSGPTHIVKKEIKQEDKGGESNCVFSGDTLESFCVFPDSKCCVDTVPSTHCSSWLSPPVCPSDPVSVLPVSVCAVSSPPGAYLTQSQCKVDSTVELQVTSLTVHVPEAVVPKITLPIHDATAPQVSVSEATVPDVLVSEAALPEVIKIEAALPDGHVTEAAIPEADASKITKLKDIENPSIESTHGKQGAFVLIDSVLDDRSCSVTGTDPQVNPNPVLNENREMVRLIQEVDARIDSFCQKRSNRASKRFGSSEIEEIEIKTESMPKAKRCARTRKSSCRSDKSESEGSDSRSVLDDPLYLDMVDKTAKRGKPKNGELLLDEAAALTTNKYNGDVGIELVNGVHKVKGRRVSRANSDESDVSSCSKSNGNVDHNNDKIDFSVLLEISEADRKKFESKKAKIRRKTADWLLISETERYYNEKEEIMRNKNRQESESESDDSDNDSESDCSDENESTTGNSQRAKGKGKRKPSKPVEEDDPKVGAKRMKEDLDTSNVRGRPIGSRNRKTRYDLTMLNDDEDDDDENFFGFPVSTPIAPSIQSCSLSSSSVCHSRGKGKNSGKNASESSSSGKVARKRLSDAERFLRDNREYYHFQETKERLRRSTSLSACDKDKVGNGEDSGCSVEKVSEKVEESKVKDSSSLPKKRPSVDVCRRVTRRTGVSVDEAECSSEKDDKRDTAKDERKENKKVNIKMERDTKYDTRNVKSERRDGLRYEKRYEVKCEKRDVPKKEESKNDKEETLKEEKEKCDKKEESKDDTKNSVKDDEKTVDNIDKSKPKDESKEVVKNEKREPCKAGKCPVKTVKSEEKSEEKSDVPSEVGEGNSISSVKDNIKVEVDDYDSEKLEVSEKLGIQKYGSELNDLYFSFEGVPENECWYQTYQRFIDGIAVNEFVYDEDPLKFVLPYEMPKEYIKDFFNLRKGLISKKKNDLADLVRKSPRCHASTLALFSDLIPAKRTRKLGKPAPPIKVEEVSSDGTSTPGADSLRMQPHESFESAEELAILAMHMDHVMKNELELEETPLCNPVIEELKDTEECDLRKTPPKKRGKKKRLLANSKPGKGIDNIVKELKLFESPFAHEVDPAFIAGISDDVKDFAPENILSRAATDVVEDSWQCLCTDRASCEDFSSADENTEASSECVSLCDSETIDSSTTSELKPVRSSSVKKRRKNLTGWPKAQKKKKPTATHTSDDNDSAIGCDDSEPKRRGFRKKRGFCFLQQQTTAQKLAALAANDRRASPRKKASVLYMDTWPVRFRTHK